MVTVEAILKAMAGKMAQRGVPKSDIDLDRQLITFWYEEEQEERRDNLHKQSMRSMPDQMEKEDAKWSGTEFVEGKWRTRINSMGESGFSVEVTKTPEHAERDEPPIDPIGEEPETLEHAINLAEATIQEAFKRLRKVMDNQK